MATTFPLSQPTLRPIRSPLRVPVVLGIATAIVVIVALIDITSPRALALVIVLAVLTPWMAAMPIRGLQVLIAAAITVEVVFLDFPDSFTDRVPLFDNLNNSLGLSGVSATPAELLMGVVLVLAFRAATPSIRARLVNGRLFAPYLLFIGVVVVSEVHGMLNGGDFNKSLWELRPQAYGFVGFVIASLLVRSRKDLERLAVVAVVAILLKAVIGDFRYFIVLNHSLGSHETVLAHEDSYFLSLLPMAALASLIWTGWTRTTALLTIASVVAMGALLANERRAGILALDGGIVVIVLLSIRYNVVRRKRIAVLALVGAAVSLTLLAVFWNDQHGLIGQLVRPIRSQFDPTARDYLSDIYRQAEAWNLKLSFATNKVIGMGFGMPFLIVLSQADISSVDPLWDYIPHNTLLWVGMRMGLVGSVAFWGLFGASLLETCRGLSVQRDRFVVPLLGLIGGAIIAQLFVAYGDAQLESYRNMIFIGVLLGIVNVVPSLFPEPHPDKKLLA